MNSRKKTDMEKVAGTQETQENKKDAAWKPLCTSVTLCERMAVKD